MKPISALGGGLAGATAITLLHESLKKIVPQAPRIDLLGMNAISRGLKAAGMKTPNENRLFTWALAGDLVSNSLYYSLSGVGRQKNVWIKSSLMGLAAGIAAVALPGPLGLNGKHSNKTTATKLITVGL